MIKISNPTTKEPNQYDILPELVNFIVNKVEPKKIILFGSCAKGIITPSSDIDLCIVLEGKLTPKERAKLRGALLMELLDITDFEIDIYICTEEVWRDNHRDPGTFIGKICREGKVLYCG